MRSIDSGLVPEFYERRARESEEPPEFFFMARYDGMDVHLELVHVPADRQPDPDGGHRATLPLYQQTLAYWKAA